MARGDYIDIIYRVGTAGVAKERVQATRDGGTVRMTEPRRDEVFVAFEELSVSKAIGAIRTVKVAKTDLVAAIEGHEELKRPRPVRKPKAVPA